MPARASRSLALCLVLVALPLSSMVAQQAPVYPTTRRDSVVDDYFGTKVADPYRWLEDQNSAEVARWVEAENKVTFAYLDQIPLRTAFRTRLTTLWNTPSVGVPSHMAGRLFFRMNTGLQNQSVLYELASLGGKPVMLIDPNTLSADGSVDLASYAPSPDGKYLAFGLSSGGSDWEELHVRDLATGRAVADTVHWVKYSGISWTRDGRGFFYTRFPAPPKDQVLTAAALNGKIYYHRVGTSDTADQLIYERPDRPDWYEGASVTDDGRYLFITLNHGTNPENLLYYADLGDPMHPDVGAAIRAVNTSDDAEYGPIGNIGNTVFLETTKDAPNRRIIALDLPDTALAHARTVVPETKNNIQSSLIAGDRVVVQTLEDVQSRVRLYAPGGALVGQVVLPGVGAVEALGGRAGRPELFYAFSSYLAPTTVYRYDFATRRSTAFSPLPRKTPFDASPYETRQVFYHSKDGTRVPMFITARKGVTLDGSHPTILYAYGGFDIATLPAYSPTVAVWLEHGGIYAVANIRGGSEYGEAWHHAGQLANKQNVFDDFIAAAEYLIREKYTSPAHLAIHGYSNGGLLVGAVEEERPDLFAAAYPGAGVMDMLRYQKFSAGIGWVPEYGSSDNPEQFRYLIKFSPVQNAKPGVCYPATIVTTADHDDRVVPGHSYKFTAAMQAAQGCKRPILIRVETKTSHGYMPTDKRIAQLADVWAFTAWETGMKN
ncbi:MAG TPA: prolyl oligopeptidase family serine peptidase [Gemmatimonadaceae bacterium]|nr:prolyl oligopeptidase family serine peptidase [Gemmatimonadaceae bacterium]